MRIPYGEVVTYGDIAREMAARMGWKSLSGQAVGGAVGHNPISIIIPCHRVVGSNGSLTGYAGGIETKRWLLERKPQSTPGPPAIGRRDDPRGRRASSCRWGRNTWFYNTYQCLLIGCFETGWRPLSARYRRVSVRAEPLFVRPSGKQGNAGQNRAVESRPIWAGPVLGTAAP